MSHTDPRRNQLRKRLICLIGKYVIDRPRSCPEGDLKADVRRFYADLPPTRIDAAVDDLLLELDEKGILQLGVNNQLRLTQAGPDEYKSIAVDMELKQKKKAQRVVLRQKEEIIEQQKAESKSVHEKLKVQLGQLAHFLGRTWKQEHELVKGGPVILDLVWYGKSRRITHAFEVQHRGQWKNAIGNLEAAKRYYPDCNLFLLVHSEKQIVPIQRLLGAEMNASIHVLRVRQLQDWLRILETIPEDMRPKLIEIVDGMRVLS
jgi:hypothetical protein